MRAGKIVLNRIGDIFSRRFLPHILLSEVKLKYQFDLYHFKINLNGTGRYVVGYAPEEGRQPTAFHAEHPGRIKIFYGLDGLTEAFSLADASNEKRQHGSWNVYEHDGCVRVDRPHQRTESELVVSLADVEYQPTPA